MLILIASALFPPDIADPAPYIKELALRLSAEHKVTVLTYGSIPEAVDNTEIIVVPKRLPAFLRLVRFTAQFLAEARKADRILIENAPSTELPMILIGLFYRSKLTLHQSDQKIVYVGWRKLLHRIASKLSNKTVTIELPLPRPEILPFSDLSADAMSEYEQSWSKHLRQLKNELS